MQTMARSIVRDAKPVDVDAVRAVIAAANAEFDGRVPAWFFRSYLASVLDIEARVAEGASVLVAEADERILGSITYYADANDEGMGPGFPVRTAGLRATAVHPGARGLGVGGALVDACIERATAAGKTAIALHTASFMAPAVALYERAGFRRAPTFDYAASEFFAGDPADDFPALAFIRPIR